VPQTEAPAGLLVDPLSCSAREISIAKQQNWGRSAALVSNASVALIALFWQALLEHGSRYNVETSTLLEIGRLIAERLVRICHGQHLDLTASCKGHLSLEEYDRMIEGKTGEIDGLACEAGAVLAGAVADRHLWRTLGMERAVAQQLYDDYMDLAEDLASGGQISHPVRYGLEVADESRKKTILTLLDVASSGLSGAQQATQQLRTVLSELGAEYYTLTCMVVRQKRALAALEALHMPQETRDWLYRWVQSVDPLYSHAADSHVPWS
jgi:geranylgeranyl pyrophosphate synthase